MISYGARMSRALLLASSTQWVVTSTALLRLQVGGEGEGEGEGGREGEGL